MNKSMSSNSSKGNEVDPMSLRVESEDQLVLVEAPYMKTPPSKVFTLVLDLDETLLHYEEKNEVEGELKIRPGAPEFLAEMSKHFEVVIFTAAMKDYADWALAQIPTSNLITARFYREHALPFQGFYVKDLSRIGRTLSNMIIVDNIAENFQLQPENGIFIKSWFNDPKDTALTELAPLLKAISERGQGTDVRDALRIFREQMLE
mmetsp:Transcript_24348/g.23961  ORF Transcript_24348/g.23961 Transcript_24348/m.23961 type:complete len:205 (+) Transcript_24348:207-821(+)